jgi:hypothetical protein
MVLCVKIVDIEDADKEKVQDVKLPESQEKVQQQPVRGTSSKLNAERNLTP